MWRDFLGLYDFFPSVGRNDRADGELILLREFVP
jgi:hypothetical protein